MHPAEPNLPFIIVDWVTLVPVPLKRPYVSPFKVLRLKLIQHNVILLTLLGGERRAGELTGNRLLWIFV
jgi:hypothetical protein